MEDLCPRRDCPMSIHATTSHPLHTFFAQILDATADEDGDNRTILWIRGEFGAVPDLATVVKAVHPFDAIPVRLAQTLQSERTASVQNLSGKARTTLSVG